MVIYTVCVGRHVDGGRRAVAAAHRLHPVDGARGHPHGRARALHLPLRRVRLRDRAVRALRRGTALRALQQQGPGTGSSRCRTTEKKL